MRTAVTKEQIKLNLIKEFVTKPKRYAIVYMVGSIIIAVLGFGTSRLAISLLGAAGFVYGVVEFLRCRSLTNRIRQGDFYLSENRLVKKEVKAGSRGSEHVFVFQDGITYAASEKEDNLWNRAREGDGFYLVYFNGKNEVRKIYPKSVIAFEEE